MFCTNLNPYKFNFYIPTIFYGIFGKLVISPLTLRHTGENPLIMKKLYAVIALVCFFAVSQAQISKGKNFWFGLMQNYAAPDPYSDTVACYITTDIPTTGTISVPLLGWSQTFSATPGVSTRIILPITTVVDDQSDVVTSQGIHVVSNECISVFAYNGGPATADASIVYPINSIGSDYIINTYQEVSTGTAYNGPTELMVVGNFNGTTISITPSTTAGVRSAGVPYTITLDSGQTYLLQATADLTGTRITGTNGRDFSVYGGSTCITVNNNCCCDHVYEQMPPVSNLGTEYVTVPYGVPQPDRFRMVGVQNGTNVYRNGTLLTTLNAGQVYDYNSTTVDYITSNYGISLNQLMGSSWSGGTSNDLGDPFMIEQSPTSQRISLITFPTITFIGAASSYYWYVNIVAKTADVPTITLDGVAPPAGTFTPVPANPAFSSAHVSLTFGDHHIASNEGVIGYVYGYSDYYESFGYQAGVLVQIPHLSVYDSTKAYCPFDTVQINLNSPDTLKMIYSEWDLGDGSPHLFDTLHFWHIYNNYGAYPITLIYELQGACQRDTMVIDTIKILGPEPNFHGPFDFCSPQSLTLSPTFRIVPDTLYWTVGGNTFFTTPPNTTYTFNATQDTVVYLKITSNICPGYDTARIYVAHDTAGFTFTNACTASPVSFTNTSQIANGLTYNWYWDFGDGNTSIAQSTTHQYSTGGIYNVKLRLTSPAGCADSIIHAVTIDSRPTVGFTAANLCNDSVLSPLNTSTISSGTMVFDWSFGDGSAHTSVTNPTHTYHQSGAYNVKLVATSGGSCADSLSQLINVILGPNIQFMGTNVCLGQASNFTDQTVNNTGSAVLDYRWNFGDGNSSTQQNTTHTYTNAGTYNVSLVLHMGANCYDSITKPISAYPPPSAAFNVADLCNSGTTTPVNTSTVSSGNMTFSWDFGDATGTVNGQNPPHTYALSGNYNIQLIAVSDSGCRDTVINPITVIRGTNIAFNAPSVCVGLPTVFTDGTTNPYNTTINGYQWTFGDGNSSTQQNTTNTYATSGTYTAKLVLDYGNNCADSLTKQVTVYPNPTVAFTIGDLCNDSVAAPQNTSSIATGTLTYAWNFGDGTALATGQNPSHTYHQSNNYNVTLVATSNNNCIDSLTQPINVIIGTFINFSAPPVCLGAPSVFTDQTSNPYNTTITGYTWIFGDGNTATTQNATNTYAATGTYNVQLLLDYGPNCAGTVTKQVIVNENPVAAFTVADLCNDSVATPVNNSTISTGTLTYAWDFGDGSALTSGNNPSHTYHLSNSYTVKLVATSNAGCADSTTNPIQVIIGTHIAFLAPPVCDGRTTIFTDQTSNPYNTPIIGYTWSFGDGNSSNQQNTSNTYAGAGTYNVTLQLDYTANCSASATQQVVVNPNPVADFSATTPCDGQNMQFTDLSTPAGSVTGFNWAFGDGNASIAQNPQHIYPTSGNFNATLISSTAAGCADTTTKQVTVLVKGVALFTAPDVCYPNATTFNNGTDVVTYPINNFSWTFGDASAPSTATSPTYTYTAPGSYNVMLIANFANGCSDTITHTVQVFPIPTVTSVVTDVSCFNGSDGSISQTPAIGTTPFTYVWNTPATTASINNLIKGDYQVTFTDANTCTSSATYTITEPTLLSIDTAVSPVICAGYADGAIAVSAAGGTPAYIYLWSNGTSNSTATNLKAGTYNFTVTDAKGCSVTASVTLDDPAAYGVIVNPVETIDLGNSIELMPTAVNGNPVSWEWTPGDYLSCTSCQNTEAKPYYDFTYTVTTIDDKGCKAKAEVQVIVIPVYDIFIPNAFTPNGDGNNDYFEVYGNKTAWKQFEVKIFDRIGEMVFESDNMNFKWDGTYKGKVMPPAVYVYTVSVVYIDNHTDKLYKGSFTLLR